VKHAGGKYKQANFLFKMGHLNAAVVCYLVRFIKLKPPCSGPESYWPNLPVVGYFWDYFSTLYSFPWGSRWARKL